MTNEKRTKEKEGSGTPTDAVFHVRTSGCGARHGEIGSRRPSAAGALVPLTALPLGLFIAKVRLQAMLPLGRRYPISHAAALNANIVRVRLSKLF
ncbi:MAG: hypothetical protein WBD83_26275 [Xanthobacteraceae bacterium]